MKYKTMALYDRFNFACQKERNTVKATNWIISKTGEVRCFARVCLKRQFKNMVRKLYYLCDKVIRFADRAIHS